MGIKAGTDGTIRLVGICKGRDPFCRLCDWCDNFLVHHVLKGFLNLFSAFIWDFPMSMLDKGFGGI